MLMNSCLTSIIQEEGNFSISQDSKSQTNLNTQVSNAQAGLSLKCKRAATNERAVVCSP